MVTSRRHVWVKFLAIILLMTLLLRFSPSVTQTEPFAPLEWRLYVACNFLLLALYYPLAGRATEKITSRQLWLMLGGSILYALISWTTNIFRYPDISTITLRLGVVVPILMGLAFGPAVGFVVGSAGNHLGDFISGWGFFPLWNLGNGLMGLVALPRPSPTADNSHCMGHSRSHARDGLCLGGRTMDTATPLG